MTKVLLKVNNKVMATDGKLMVGEKQEGIMLKTLLDTTKSTSYLFKNYQGDNLSDLIKYNYTENVTNFIEMFQGCSSTTFPQLDTSNGTNFSYMFSNCKNATSFPQLDTSNGTNFYYMFNYCKNATSFPQLDTSNGTNFSGMFSGCDNATSFPQLDTSNGTNFSGMFSGCYKAIKIDISKITGSTYTDTAGMFFNCYSLKIVIIRSFDSKYYLYSNAFSNCYHILGTQNETYNPNGDKDGYIYVPRDMITTLQSATNWSALQFRALEDYTDDGTTTGKFLDEKAGI